MLLAVGAVAGPAVCGLSPTKVSTVVVVCVAADEALPGAVPIIPEGVVP
jgi:hypothetical protein